MNKILFSFLFLLGTLSFVGCAGGDSPSRANSKSTAVNLVYSKDDRTGLCFGSIKSMTSAGWEVVSITNVPCDKVENLLVK